MVNLVASRPSALAITGSVEKEAPTRERGLPLEKEGEALYHTKLIRGCPTSSKIKEKIHLRRQNQKSAQGAPTQGIH